MTHTLNPVDQLQSEIHRAALHAGPAITALARAGYAAKGVVYVLVGGLAFLAAVTSQGATTGSRGALRALLRQPYGRVMLTLVAIGLAAYALWCFVRAIVDPQRDGTDAKGIGKRATQFCKGIVHAGLVAAAVGMIRGSARAGGADDGDSVRDWTAWLMAFPQGVWLVGIAGLAVVGYGARQIYRAWCADLDKRLTLDRMNPGAARSTVWFSRFGVAARGVVFGVIGLFLVVAAYRHNPREVKGVGEALGTLARQPYGPFLLAAVSLGLVAYGGYQFILARYRRIERP